MAFHVEHAVLCLNRPLDRQLPCGFYLLFAVFEVAFCWAQASPLSRGFPMGCAASTSPDSLAERNLTSVLEILFDSYGKPTEQVRFSLRTRAIAVSSSSRWIVHAGSVALALQVGYTDGHYCVTTDDKATAMLASSSLLYGEILPAGTPSCVPSPPSGGLTPRVPRDSGITKLLSYDYLCAGRAQVLFDLGMGVGKLVLQAFLQYPNLKYVCGVELAISRYNIAEQALLRMASLQVRPVSP